MGFAAMVVALMRSRSRWATQHHVLFHACRRGRWRRVFAAMAGVEATMMMRSVSVAVARLMGREGAAGAVLARLLGQWWGGLAVGTWLPVHGHCALRDQVAQGSSVVLGGGVRAARAWRGRRGPAAGRPWHPAGARQSGSSGSTGAGGYRSNTSRWR